MKHTISQLIIAEIHLFIFFFSYGYMIGSKGPCAAWPLRISTLFVEIHSRDVICLTENVAAHDFRSFKTGFDILALLALPHST
jgi:hypothetical protein